MEVEQLRQQRDAIGTLRRVLEELIEECGFAFRYVKAASDLLADKQGFGDQGDRVSARAAPVKNLLKHRDELVQHAQYLLGIPGVARSLREGWEEIDEASWIVQRCNTLETMTPTDITELRRRCTSCVKRLIPNKQKELLEQIKVAKRKLESESSERAAEAVLQDDDLFQVDNNYTTTSSSGDIPETMEHGTQQETVSGGLLNRALCRILSELCFCLESAVLCEKRIRRVRAPGYLVRFETERADLQHRFEQNLKDLSKWHYRNHARAVEHVQFVVTLLEAYSMEYAKPNNQEQQEYSAVDNTAPVARECISKNSKDVERIRKQRKQHFSDNLFNAFNNLELCDAVIKDIRQFLREQQQPDCNVKKEGCGVVARDTHDEVAHDDDGEPISVTRKHNYMLQFNEDNTQPWTTSVRQQVHRASDPVHYRRVSSSNTQTAAARKHLVDKIRGKQSRPGAVQSRHGAGGNELRRTPRLGNAGLALLGKRFKGEIVL